MVEWREAADCWMRYHVDPRGARRPDGRYPPRKLLTLQIYSLRRHRLHQRDARPQPGTRTFTWTPESIRTGTIQTSPSTHGASLIVVPEGWTGPLPDLERVAPIDPRLAAGAAARP